MLELRRIRAGIFKEDDEKYPSINLYDFEKAVDDYKNGEEKSLREIIIPAEIVSQVYSSVEIKDINFKQILTGKPIYENDLIKKKKIETGKTISVFSGERFIGMYKVVNEAEIFAKAKFVLQEIKQRDTPSDSHTHREEAKHCPEEK